MVQRSGAVALNDGDDDAVGEPRVVVDGVHTY